MWVDTATLKGGRGHVNTLVEYKEFTFRNHFVKSLFSSGAKPQF
jgi:hypothetical protein